MYTPNETGGCYPKI